VQKNPENLKEDAIMFALVIRAVEQSLGISANRPRLRRRPSRASLALEPLEDRLALSHSPAHPPAPPPPAHHVAPPPFDNVHVVPGPTPTPKPSPIQSPSPGYSQINPATYIPEYCTSATFGGTMGSDGHYSSFQIIGHNAASGTTVIIGYSIGTPYGTPVYHWAVTVESRTYGNWGSLATVSQPYYADFLPYPVSYHMPDFGPG
jgi:hypothetical protein